MGAIQLPEELQRVIDREVAHGRAVSLVAFLEEAVMRLVDATEAEEAGIAQAATEADADIKAGRFTTVATPEDGSRLHERLMVRLQDRLGHGG